MLRAVVLTPGSSMSGLTRRRRRAALVSSVTSIALLGLVPALTAGSAEAEDTAFAPQLVTVDTPTRAHKRLLQTLGLDLTEHAGHDYVEVVLHNGLDRDALQAAGLTYDVRIPDLVRREAENNEVNAAYAAVYKHDHGAPARLAQFTCAVPEHLAASLLALGVTSTADYADYIRDVARWDRRGNIPPNDDTGWLAPVVRARPMCSGPQRSPITAKVAELNLNLGLSCECSWTVPAVSPATCDRSCSIRPAPRGFLRAHQS